MNNTEHDAETLRRIDEALKGLPVLRAPSSLQARVMATLQAREIPWHRQAWIAWPLAARTATLALLSAVFALVCFGAYRLPGLPGVQNFRHEVAPALSTASAFWQAGAAVLGAIPQVVRAVPTPWLVGCLTAAGLGYLMCMGLGTVYVRLALSPKH